jgi:GNAT superfamily N-acetyltransferase
MESFLGADAEAVRAAPAWLNCLPRVAALELLEGACGAALVPVPPGAHAVLRAAGGDLTIYLHFTEAPAEGAAFGLPPAATPLWAEACASAGRVVFSAVPHAAVPYVSRALAAAGRAVSSVEPCRTWEPAAPPAATAATAAALPPGHAFVVLAAGDAPLVDGAWKYRAAATEAMVRECISRRLGVGVRGPAGGLVAWTVLRADGSWGLLHVVPEARRRGLARALMVHALAAQRAWAEGGGLAAAAGGGPRAQRLAAMCPPYVHITVGNTVSEALFTSLGFAPGAHVTWVISQA